MRLTAVLALPDRQWLWELELPAGAQVAEALAMLGALPDPVLQSIDWAQVKVGVFGRVVSVADRMSDGDRLEIYRPLAMDPKDSRRARARRR